MKEEEILRIRKMLKELEKIRGRHTELVSVYVPAGGNLQDSINQIKNEESTASNIKSKTTRKNVLSALEKIVQHLKFFRQTPPNGLVVFCGNISPVEGKEDYKIWSFEPPEKMSTKLYHCDQVFVLDPLRDMIAEKEVYGLIVLDAHEATIGLLKGKKISVLKNIEGNVPSKTVKGGMSQGRYDRLREDAVHEFMRKISDVSGELLLKQKLVGLIIGGPGPVKDKFVKENYMNYQLQKILLGVKDIGYTGEYGLEELVNKSQDLLQQAAVTKEIELMKKFFTDLQKSGNVIYGYTETLKALNMGAVETLLLSEEFEWVRVKFECQNNHKVEKDIPKKLIDMQLCEKCGNKLRATDQDEIGELMTEKAIASGAEVKLISTDTREGQQFKELGGVGAFLRYKVEKLD